MNRIRRQINAAINPASTAATRWWCHSALRRMLTGYGPIPRQRRPINDRTLGASPGRSGDCPPAPEEMTERMKARAKAIDDLLGRDH
jgi:hypothetical protein